MTRFHWVTVLILTLMIVFVFGMASGFTPANAGEGKCQTITENDFRKVMMSKLDVKPDATFSMKKEAVDKIVKFANTNLRAQGYPGPAWAADTGLIAIYKDNSVMTALFNQGCFVSDSQTGFSQTDWNEFVTGTGISPKELTIDVLGKTGVPS